MARCVAFYADVYAPGLRTARAARVYRPPVGAVCARRRTRGTGQLGTYALHVPEHAVYLTLTLTLTLTLALTLTLTLTLTLSLTLTLTLTL